MVQCLFISRVHKLRTITLLEEDANFAFKQIGRKIMAYNEHHNNFAKEQYGSRKGHNAILHGLNKKLFYDITRQSVTPETVCSNDATQCYDRIAHPLLFRLLQKSGVPPATSMSFILTVEKMKHHIRTGNGDSVRYFKGENWEIPPQGVIQGSGAAPAYWSIISSFLLNIMQKERLGAFIKTPISHHSSQLVGFSFVDNTDLITVHTEDQTESLQDNSQKSLNFWK